MRLQIEIDEEAYQQIRKQVATVWRTETALTGDEGIVRTSSLGGVLQLLLIILNAINQGEARVEIKMASGPRPNP